LNPPPTPANICRRTLPNASRPMIQAITSFQTRQQTWSDGTSRLQKKAKRNTHTQHQIRQIQRINPPPLHRSICRPLAHIHHTRQRRHGCLDSEDEQIQRHERMICTFPTVNYLSSLSLFFSSFSLGLLGLVSRNLPLIIPHTNQQLMGRWYSASSHMKDVNHAGGEVKKRSA
jgi:hypothetical protein